MRGCQSTELLEKHAAAFLPELLPCKNLLPPLPQDGIWGAATYVPLLLTSLTKPLARLSSEEAASLWLYRIYL